MILTGFVLAFSTRHFCFQLFSRTVRVLLHSSPGGFNVSRLARKIQKIKGIVEIHDFHAWSLTNSKKVASLHGKISHMVKMK